MRRVAKMAAFRATLLAGFRKAALVVKSRFVAFKTDNPGGYQVARIAVIAVLLFVVGLRIWYAIRPEPARLMVTIEAPGLTPIRKDAKPDRILVKFNGSAARLEDVQKEITQGVEIDPEIPGKWKWVKDNALQFQATRDWPADTEFEVRLSEALFPSHVLLDKYEIPFRTQVFRVSISSKEFYVDPVDEDLKQVAVTVTFTHPVDPESFEKRIKLRPEKLDSDVTTFQNRDYDFTVTYDEYFAKAYILSEALPMPEDDVYMRLNIMRGVKCVFGGEPTSDKQSTRVTVPGISNFIRINSIAQTMVRNDEYKLEQVLIVNSKGKARGTDLQENMEVWILPRDRPKAPGVERRVNYRWSDPSIIGPVILESSTRVEIEPIASEHEYEDLNSFKIKVDPGKYLYIKLKKGTPFYGKYSLSKDHASILRVKQFPKQLEIMHEGMILSTTGERKVSLMAQGIDAVQFRLGRVQPDQLNHLVSQSNGDITNIRFRNNGFSEYNIVENQYEARTLSQTEPGEPNYFSFDFSGYLQPKPARKLKHGIFFFEAREWDERRKRTTGLGSKRLIIVSDLGVLIKDGTSGTHEVFVQSISTGFPVSGAKVKVLGKNGLPIMSALTDQTGHVMLGSMKGFKNEHTPTVYLVTKGDDLSFLPVNAPGRWLDYSRFDAGGVHGARDPRSIDAYLFSDRGIYRPGDRFNIGIVVKSGDWRRSLSGTPLEAAIIDARGLEIYKRKFRLSPEGFEELDYKTENTSPTGTYQINLYTIRKNRRWRNIGSTTLKIEEFLPDRLSITTSFLGGKEGGWASPDSLKGLVTLRNLFGTPASGNRITASMRLSPGRLRFRSYPDFRFTDPFKQKSYSEALPEQKTNQEGEATFEFNLQRFDAATFTVSFLVDAFEKGSGRNVSSEASILVSPLPYLLGTKPDGDLSYIYRGADRSVRIIAIDPELKKTAVPKVELELNEIKHVSVLTKRPNGTFAYKSVRKKELLSTTSRAIPEAGLDYAVPTDAPGEYELRIKDSDGLVLSRVLFSVIGSGNLTRSLDKTAELEIKLNKSDYEPGEEIEVYVKAPYTGAGLITIERDRVYTYEWFHSRQSSFIRKIRLPAELEGNGYVNVSFVRAADSKEVFMSPLSYGVAAFSVSKKNRTNELFIDFPEEARSGEPFLISYSSDKPGKIVVLAVDEGILQVAGYTTPDPLAYFFKKRALEVKTSQLLDLILPEFSLFRSRGAMGGGADFEDIAKNLNPFKRKRHKPVAYWSGIVDSDATTRRLEYTVPDYFNGTIRVMAVVVSPDAIGTFEGKAIVKNPFVISPNVPMFAAPHDSFQVTVTVTNAVKGSGRALPVAFEVTSSKHLKVFEGKRNLMISEDADTTLTFHIKANDLPGGASLNFKASGNGESTTLGSYLSVRPAQPYQTRLTSGVLEKGDVEVKTPRQLYEDFRVLNASVSFLPLGLSKGLKTYLDRYPYGCTEQVVSQSLPYLYLRDVNGFGITDSSASDKISYTLNLLQARQNGEGHFGIWAANSHTSDFITVYGMHFMTECRKAGYYVSDQLYGKTSSALKKIASQKGKTLRELRIQAYAIYVLTTNEIVTTNYIASVRKRLEERHPAAWKSDLAGAYLAAAYTIMQQKKEASGIFQKILKSPLTLENPWHFSNSFIQHAQLLYLLSEHAPEKLRDVSARIISQLASHLEEGGYNTITSAYTIMALSAYAKVAGTPVGGDLSITQVLADKSRETLQLPTGQFPTVDYSAQARKLVFENGEELPLYYQVVQGGFDTTLPEERVSNGIEVFREFTNADGKPVNRISLGDEVEVHLKFRSLKQDRLHNIAIVDLLPAGLEAVPTSVRRKTSGSWRPDYTDIREDRLIIFGTVEKSVREFVYSVRAINKGQFTVPPIYAESMYDRNIYGFSPQTPIVVE